MHICVSVVIGIEALEATALYYRFDPGFGFRAFTFGCGTPQPGGVRYGFDLGSLIFFCSFPFAIGTGSYDA